MTIVASNSLTISNVNDGTITHTAYAYSADGTDRFTTVYPNLNLLVNSSAKTKDGFFKNFDKVENDYGEVTIKGTNTWVSKNLWDGFSIQPRDYKPNDVYTMSMDVMFTSWNLPVGTTLTEFWIGQRYSNSADGSISSYKQICAIDLPRDPSQMLNQWIRITKTSTIPPLVDPSVRTEALFMTKFTGASEGSFTVRVKKPKQEVGLIATPYMPNASEVKTADYPSYRGEYSDYSSTASTDPSKYSWGLIKGSNSYTHTAYSWSADGKDGFTTVYPNLNLLTDSKDFKNKNVAESKATTSITSPDSTILKEGNDTYLKFIKSNQSQDWFRAYMIRGSSVSPDFPNVDVKPNSQYTFSVWLKGTGTHTIIAYNNWTSPTPTTLTVTLTDNWTRYSLTVVTSANIPTQGAQFFIRSSTVGSEINLKYPKVELGSTATPWMPSSGEVKTSDYPSYIGTYSDSNVESSLDYSKYQWAIFKGQNSNAYTAYSWSVDGTDRFSTVYPNLNLLINSRLLTSNTDYAHWEPNNSTLKIIQNGLNVSSQNINKGSDNGVVQRSIPFSVGKPITISCWVTNNSDVSISSFKLQFRFDAPSGNTYPSKIFPTVLLKGNRTKFEYTYVVPSNTTLVSAYFLVNSLADSSSFNFDLTDMKAEQDSIATPWMPSESEAQDQWQDAIPMYVGVGEKDSQNPTDYRWQLNPRYVQASSDSGLSNKAGLDDLASVADTANDALVQAQNAVSNEDYTSWLEHDYQTTINNLQDVSAQNQEDINNVDDRTTIVEGFYGEMKVKWNFIDESFTFSEEGMFISNAQSKMAIQVTSDKIVFWDNNVDVAFITGEVLNIQKGVFLESATIGNHLITKFSDDSPVTIIRYVGGIT